MLLCTCRVYNNFRVRRLCQRMYIIYNITEFSCVYIYVYNITLYCNRLFSLHIISTGSKNPTRMRDQKRDAYLINTIYSIARLIRILSNEIKNKSLER